MLLGYFDRGEQKLDVIAFRYNDEKKYNKIKMYCVERGITINQFFSEYIDKTLKNIDGLGIGLENFMGAKFIPKPDIDQKDVEGKIVPWLRTLETDKLNSLKPIMHQTYIFASALRDIEPDKRHTSDLPYSVLWKRYTW